MFKRFSASLMCLILFSACQQAPEADGAADMAVSAVDTGADVPLDLEHIKPFPIEVASRCAPDRSVPAPIMRASSAPLDKVVSELVWSKEVRCEGREGRAYSAGLSMLLSDAGVEVLVSQEESMFDDYTEFYLMPGISHLLTLDRRDGRELSCVDGFVGQQRMPSRLGTYQDRLIQDYQGHTVLLMARQELAFYEIPPDEELDVDEFLVPWFSAWWSSAWAQPWHQVDLWQDILGAVPAMAAELMPDGQLLVWSDYHWFSVDSQTGEINWVVQASEIARRGGLGWADMFGLVWDEARRELSYYVQRPAETTTYRKVTLGHCGQLRVEAMDEERVFTRVPLGAGLVAVWDSHGRIKVLNAAGEVLSRHPWHSLFVSGEPGQVIGAQLKASANHVLELTILGADGRVESLDVDGSVGGLLDPSINYWLASVVALDGGVLLFELKENELSARVRRLIFYSLAHKRIIGEFTLEASMSAVDDSVVVGPPLVDDDGMIYFNRFNRVYALKTNTTGLARSAFPRGLMSADNQNRRYWSSEGR